MVHKMKKEYLELEAQARKTEAFVDYEPVTPIGSLFAMKCVVSDKKGARICRFASDIDIATAQEHAGYMALSAYFNKEVDENLYATRTGSSVASATQTLNPSVAQDQTQTNQTASGNNRGQQQNAGTPRQNGQNVPPQQNRPSAANQQQNRQNMGQQKPGGNQSMPGTYNQNQPQTNASAQPPSNHTQQQTAGVNRPNGQGTPMQGQSQQSHPTTGQQTTTGTNPVMPGAYNQNQSNASAQASGNRAPQQNIGTTRPNGQNGSQQNRPAPQQQNDSQQPQNTSGKPEDVRVPVALFKHREENHVSDLLKIEAGRSILRSIYCQNKLTDELMTIQPKVRAYMDYYHIPIADEAFVKSGEC